MLNRSDYSFADTLKDLRKQNGLSQKQLAETLHVTQGTIGNWETGKRTPDLDTMFKLSDLFKIDVELLATGYSKNAICPNTVNDDVPLDIANASATNIYNIPVYETVSAGFGAYADNCIIEYIPVALSCPSQAADTIAVKVKGDSMSPLIVDGDKIVVHKQTSVDSGDIAILLLDGEEALVKKVKYDKTWIELHSVNPYYPVRKFVNEEVLRLQVLGKVIGSYRSF